MARPVSIQPVNVSLIRHVIKQRGLTHKDVGDSLGVSRQYVSGMLSGREKINDARLAALPVDYTLIRYDFTRFHPIL